MKHPLRRRWIFLSFFAFRTIMRWLPLSIARALGACLGWCAYALLGEQRRLTWQHLRHAFGAPLSDRTCAYIARRTFVNLGKTAAEWCVFARYSQVQIRRLVDAQGLQHLRKALEQGRGVIAVTGHFGNWELLPMAMGSYGCQGAILARPLRYPEYEQFLLGMRSRLGVTTYARGSVKDVLRVLKANQIIGTVPDQDTDSLDGIFVEFFGRPAYTPVGPAALSLMTGAPIVPCFCVRSGHRFRMIIEEPILAPAIKDRAAALQQMTQAWSGVVETHIRRYPDQWTWMHRRWKTQPGQRSADSVQRSEVNTARRRLQPALTAMVLALVSGLWSLVYPVCVEGATKASPNAPKAGAAVSDDTGQQMDAFKLVGYTQDGAKKWELVGTGATVDGPWVTIRRPDAVGYTQDRTAYMTAAVAQLEQSTRRVRMEQDVIMHTSDGLWLMSPLMYWLPDQNQMRTDERVRLETDHMLVRGYGAVAQTVLKHATIQHDIEVVLNPKEAKGSERSSHVQITCDGPLSFDYERHIATFEQNVHVVDQRGEIFSDKLVAYMDPNTRMIKYAEALGNVRIVQGANVATSNRAVYEPAYAKVTLVGTPSLLLYPDEHQNPAVAVGGVQQLMAPRASAKPAPKEMAKEDLVVKEGP